MEKIKMNHIRILGLVLLSITFVGQSFGKESVDLRNEKDSAKFGNLEIEHAYRTATGQLVICFGYKGNFDGEAKANPDSINKDKCFYGDEKGFFQMSDSGYGGSTDKHVQDFKIRPGDRKGATILHMDFGKDGVYLLDCGTDDSLKDIVNLDSTWAKNKEEFIDKLKEKGIDPAKLPKNNLTPLSKDEVSALNKKIQGKKIPLWSLPDYREPQYYFKGSDGESYYVGADAAQFTYESFRLYKGKPGAMKEIKIKNVERYRDGGTTYITGEDGSVLFSPSGFGVAKKQATFTGPDGKVVNLEKALYKDTKFDFLGLPAEEMRDAKSVTYRTPCEGTKSEQSNQH